ncbi:MAG: ATPase, T2SS/T4P/T4SS family [Planctomycetota bacterium]
MALGGTKRLLGEILKSLGYITDAQLIQGLTIQKERGGAIGTILINEGVIDEEQLNRALGMQFGMEVVDLDNMDIAGNVIELVPPSVAEAYKIVPVELAPDGTITVAMANPTNIHALDDLRFHLGAPVKGAISNPEAVDRAFTRYYSEINETVEGILAELEKELPAEAFQAAEATETIDLESIEEMSESAPVRRLLGLVLLQAVRDRASDIHFEPFEDEFKIRYRIDGLLYEMVPPPKHLAMAIISRIKVMSNLDIAERRLPQDGRIELNIAGNPVELRVAILPTMYGESCVMRVLDRSVVSLDLERLGFRPDELEIVQRLIRKPNGIVLVTGPTGCGKTTTLYSALNEINSVEDKIITTEDPVEYSIEGVIQCGIREEIGLTFASCLRSILRQDPDEILVGEIRDLETAEIAVQASLTGHLVFSTLHTNDAPSTITRLIEIGVEPFLLTATVEAVIAQRLVRRICTKCRVEYEPSEVELAELAISPAEIEGKKFYRGKGCSACNNIGYKGRLALFEIMVLNEKIRQLITQRTSTDALREVAIQQGMKPLRDSGLLGIFDGLTTIEEVVRETVVEFV